MKKTILTLGLSTLLTMSNLSASYLKISNPFADEPLTIENLFKGFYIETFGSYMPVIKINSDISLEPEAITKNIADTRDFITPHVNSWIYTYLLQLVNYDQNILQQMFNNANNNNNNNYNYYYSQQSIMRMKNNFVVGVALGASLNEYTAIESSFSYYSSALNLYSIDKQINGFSFQRSMHTDLNIINAILNPIININITENISLYCKAGIGVSYFMFSSNVNDWRARFCAEVQNRMAEDSLNTNHPSLKGAIHHYNKQQVHLSWLLGAGVRINLTESTELNLGYSYKSLGSLPSLFNALISGVDTGYLPLRTHEIRIGIKFNF